MADDDDDDDDDDIVVFHLSSRSRSLLRLRLRLSVTFTSDDQASSAVRAAYESAAVLYAWPRSVFAADGAAQHLFISVRQLRGLAEPLARGVAALVFLRRRLENHAGLVQLAADAQNLFFNHARATAAAAVVETTTTAAAAATAMT